MTKIQKVIVVVGVALVSLLMHAYYIDYGVALEGHILPLAPSHGREAKQIREKLKTSVLHQHWTDFSDMSVEQLEAKRESMATEASLAGIDVAVAAANATGGGIELIEEKKTAERKAEALDAALSMWFNTMTNAAESKRKQTLTEIDQQSIYFGMLTSKSLSKDSSQARREAFWGGVIAPLVLIFGLLLVALQNRKELRFSSANTQASSVISDTEKNLPSGSSEKNESLADLLLAALGADFPVSSGNATEQEPLMITAETDYVGVEYTAVRHLMSILDEDYELSHQHIKTLNERMVDELVFKVKPSGSDEWTGLRNFYFDITTGFNKLRS